MLLATLRSAARAVFGVAAALWISPAFAHAVCGDRIFPATLGIDDPGVGDELALPTLTWQPQGSDGTREFDATFSWTKTILPGPRAVVQRRRLVAEARRLRLAGARHRAQVQLHVPGPARVHGLGRLRRELGSNRNGRAIQPIQYLLRRCSTSAKASATCRQASIYLRPLAITAELSEAIPWPELDRRIAEPDNAELGLHPPVQPALLQFARRPDRQRLPSPPDSGDGIRLLDPGRQRSRLDRRSRPALFSLASSTKPTLGSSRSRR